MVIQGKSKGLRDKGVGTEVYYKTWVTLSLARTPNVITLGCLDEGDERGEGQGLLLELTWLRARYGYCEQPRTKQEQGENNEATERGRSLLLSET